MNEIALQALGKLLRLTENAIGNNSNRTLSLRFSEKSFPSYFSLHTHAEKLACNATLILAEQQGAIEIEWDRRAGDRSHVDRILLKECDVLGKFIGVTPRWEIASRAREALSCSMDAYPILKDVVGQWERGLSPRGTAPRQHQDWIDAIKVVEYCRNNDKEDIPVRRLSAQMLQDSKRIESLHSVIDAIWQDNLSAPYRQQEEVFSEIGLVKFPPTFLISGNAMVSYGGAVTQVLAPYTGFSPSVIDGFQIDQVSIGVLTVENLTTFHELATRHREPPNLLVIYTGGMPSRSWVAVYRKLLASLHRGAGIWHWGDIDGGGFRIADRIASICCEENRHLKLHMMGSDTPDNPDAIRHEMSNSEVNQIVKICEKHDWAAEIEWVTRNRLAVEQESLVMKWPVQQDHSIF